MWNFVKQLYKVGAIWGMVVVALVVGTYQVVKPTQQELSINQKELLTEFEEEVEECCKGLQVDRGSLVFHTMDRDRFGRVTDAARRAVWKSDLFNLRDYSLPEKFRKTIKWTRPTVGSAQQAAERHRNCDYAMWGRVEEFSDIGRDSRLKVHMEIIDAADAESLVSRNFELKRSSVAGVINQLKTGESEKASFPLSLLIWIAIVILLPVVCYPLTRRVVTGDSNLLILLLLTGYVLVGVVAAYLLFASSESGGTFLQGIGLLIAFALVLTYNWKALDLIKTLNQ